MYQLFFFYFLSAPTGTPTSTPSASPSTTPTAFPSTSPTSSPSQYSYAVMQSEYYVIILQNAHVLTDVWTVHSRRPRHVRLVRGTQPGLPRARGLELQCGPALSGRLFGVRAQLGRRHVQCGRSDGGAPGRAEPGGHYPSAGGAADGAESSGAAEQRHRRIDPHIRRESCQSDIPEYRR